MFWRRSKFRLVEKWVVEFNDCARRQAADLGLSHDQQQAFLQRLLKDNIAQVPSHAFTLPRNCTAMAITHKGPRLWRVLSAERAVVC